MKMVMAGLIVKDQTQNIPIGYTIVDVDTQEIGNYPANKLEGVLKLGHHIENLELRRNKIHIDKDLEAQKFPVRYTNEKGQLQLIKNPYAIIITGRLNNRNIAIITSDAKTYEITYDKLVDLVIAKGVVLVNAQLEIKGHSVKILPKQKRFILDEDGYPLSVELTERSVNKQYNETNNTSENNVPHIKDIIQELQFWFDIQKREDGGYQLNGFRQGINNPEEFGQVLIIPEGIRYINDKAFENNKQIKTVYISKTVSVIGDNCFKGQVVDTVLVEEGLISIGIGAFQRSSLKNINFPRSLQYIQLNAFYETELTAVNLQGNLKSIGEYAFAFTKNLKNLLIDAQKCVIQSGAFQSQGLQDINIMQASVIEKQAFCNCVWLKRFQTNGPVNQIKQQALCGCKIVESIEFNEGLRAVQACLFDQTNIQEDPFSLSYYSFNDKLIDRNTGVDLIKLDRHLYIPDSLEKFLDCRASSGGSYKYRWHFNKYKVHIRKTCKAYAQILSLSRNLSYSSKIELIDEQDVDRQAIKLDSKAKLLGKQLVTMHLDAYNRDLESLDKKVKDAKLSNTKIEYSLDTLNTKYLYSDYKFSGEQLLSLKIDKIENTIIPEVCSNDYNADPCSKCNHSTWLGIKILNWLQTTQESAKDIVDTILKTNIESVQKTVVNSVCLLFFKYKEHVIRIIDTRLLNRFIKNSISMYLVVMDDNRLLYQAIPDMKIYSIPKDKVYPMREILVDKLKPGDTIQAQDSLINKQQISLFGLKIGVNDPVKQIAFEMYKVLKQRQINIITNKGVQLYIPEKEIVIQPSVNQKNGGLLQSQILTESTVITIDNIQTQQEQSIFKNCKNKKGTNINTIRKSFEMFYNIEYQDSEVVKQKPCKAAKIAFLECDYLKQLPKIHMCDLQDEQIIGLMDSEFIEPLAKNEADELIQKFAITADRKTHTAGDRWRLDEIWIQKQQRYNKITLQRPVSFFQKSGSQKIQCIYRLIVGNDTYYGRSQYHSSEIVEFIRYIVKFQDHNLVKSKFKRLAEQYSKELLFGTCTNGKKSIRIYSKSLLQIGKATVQHGRNIKFHVHINPFNGCAYLASEYRYEYPLPLIPLEQVEAGLEFIKEAYKKTEDNLLNSLDNMQNSIYNSYNDCVGMNSFQELILRRDQNRANYKNVLGVNQGIYQYIGLSNQDQLVDLSKYF